MSFADQLADLAKPKHSAVDRLTEWLNAMPESERDLGFIVLRSPKEFSPHLVVKIFRREGKSLSKDTVIAWREANNVI